MSSVGNKGVIIQDSLGGEAGTVTNSRLDVNAQITVASGAPTLYYYCTNHSGMGGQANTP